MTDVIRGHIVAALKFAATTRREYERTVLRFERDSGQVAAWEAIAASLEAGECP